MRSCPFSEITPFGVCPALLDTAEARDAWLASEETGRRASPTGWTWEQWRCVLTQRRMLLKAAGPMEGTRVRLGDAETIRNSIDYSLPLLVAEEKARRR